MTAARLWRSIKHTPAPQLLHRLRLLAKRRSLVAVAHHFPSISKQRAEPPAALSPNPPEPWLPTRHGQVRAASGGYAFTLLNAERKFSLPLDWHRADLNTGTRLWKLHLHYFDYAESLTDAEFQELVKDWIAQNRPYRPGYWLDSWNSYAISIRLVAWMGEYSRRRDHLDRSFLATLHASIHEQLRFLLTNLERDIGGNHLIKNIRALYWGSQFFAGPLAERCRSAADRLLAPEMGSQILADGFHFELSPAYHCQVFGDLLDCWRLMQEGRLRNALAEKLTAMAQVVADFTHPDGAVSLFNDGALSMTASGDALLEAFENLLGKRPEPRAFAQYPEAGYHVMRTDEFYLACDAGRVGPDGLPAHAHGDIFAFELTVRGQRMVVDCGVFEYSAGARRTRSRSTEAHNTVTLADKDQCEFWSAFRLGRRANVRVNAADVVDGGLIVDAEHDGYRALSGGPVHRRRTEMTQGGQLRIRDYVNGGRGQRAVSRLLLHPSVEILPLTEGRLLLQSGAARIEVHPGKNPTSIVTAPWWPDFGHEIDTKQIVFDYGEAPGEWEYRISVRGG